MTFDYGLISVGRCVRRPPKKERVCLTGSIEWQSVGALWASAASSVERFPCPLLLPDSDTVPMHSSLDVSFSRAGERRLESVPYCAARSIFHLFRPFSQQRI